MTLEAGAVRWVLILACGLMCAGCGDSSENSLNEQKDPYYLKGKSLAMSENYTAAVDAFEKALETNPRNASADFELFVIYEQHIKDYAAAIYYGERFVRLRPNSEYAPVLRQRITGYKRELAKELPVMLETPALQRDFERLSNDNKNLRQQVEMLIQKLALATNRPMAAPVAPPSSNSLVKSEPPPARVIPSPTHSTPPRVIPATVATSSPPRTHTVRSGETLVRIALRYNVRLNSLLAANPGLEPRRIRAGQTIRIPAR